MQTLSTYIKESVAEFKYPIVKFKPKASSIEVIQQMLADNDIDSKIENDVLLVLGKPEQRLAKLLIRKFDVDPNEFTDI